MGQEQTLELNNSNCNDKSGVLRHDYAQIEEKDLLPVMKIFYGPLEYEPEKMTIIVGSLVCQFNETKINYKVFFFTKAVPCSTPKKIFSAVVKVSKNV